MALNVLFTVFTYIQVTFFQNLSGSGHSQRTSTCSLPCSSNLMYKKPALLLPADCETLTMPGQSSEWALH